MSGLEIAGVALAILPILISAAEHYTTITRPISRFSKFSPEVNRYRTQLNTHSTIFRAECQLLLGHVVRDGEATKMLKSSSHPLWQDPDVNGALEKLLGDSKEALINTVSMINSILRTIEQELQSLSTIASSEKPRELDSNGFKSWRREIREKIKFSFSHRLDRSLSDLKELNDEFRALADQISKLEERRSNKVTAATPQQFLDLHKFNVIQKASNLLYESLGAACTEHEEHIAHFCLQPDLNEQSSPRVRFSIAFRHLSVAGSATVEDPIWFAVESIISKSLANNPAGVCTALTNLSNSLKRREQSPPACHSKRSKRTVTSTSSSSVVRCPSPPLIDSLPNLCVHQNLCNQIQVCLRQSSLMSNRYIGLLEEGPDCRHLVYLPSSTKHWDRKSTSLANLFVSVSRQSLRGSLPIYERLRLAKLLAAAVLQFHSTPWLKGSWRSEDVLFFGVEPGATEPTQATKFTAPYIDVSVTAPNGSFSRPSTFPSRIFAPNPFLFGLGVMLLELAYETPIRNLMRPIDLDNGQEDQHTEFFVARRLSRSGSSQMGLKYNEIARSCLHCDFGCGDDLNDAKLQQEFYRKVVCELGALEKGFRKMQLGN